MKEEKSKFLSFLISPSMLISDFIELLLIFPSDGLHNRTAPSSLTCWAKACRVLFLLTIGAGHKAWSRVV